MPPTGGMGLRIDQLLMALTSLYARNESVLAIPEEAQRISAPLWLLLVRRASGRAIVLLVTARSITSFERNVGRG